MKRQLIVIKLGGGLITDKSKPLTARADVIQFVANEIAKAYKAVAADFLLGTGAGSYGHFTAHQYGLREGAHNQEQLQGMCVTHNNVRILNGMFVEALFGRNVPGFTVSPSSMMTSAAGEPEHVNVEPLRILLGNRCVPVLHGDTVCDSKQGTSIFSTEKVLNECVKQLRQEYEEIVVVYAMQEEGVLDVSGRVIPELSRDDRVALRDSAAHDVTGGIQGKVLSARKALEVADRVHIVSGNKRGAILKVIKGEKIGTRVVQ